jgi:hypothetical protein
MSATGTATVVVGKGTPVETTPDTARALDEAMTRNDERWWTWKEVRES